MPRGIQDVLITPIAFALPAAASTSTTSTTLDLGNDAYKTPNLELGFSVPALSSTIVPNASTVTYLIESSTTSNFSAISQTLFTETLTGAGGAGVAANTRKARLPSDCARYVRFKITFGASCTTGAAVSFTPSVNF
jgi:hypothetical protein